MIFGHEFFIPEMKLSPLFAEAAKLMGFVPKAASLHRVGHIAGDVFVIHSPIRPCSCACIAYQLAIPAHFSLWHCESNGKKKSFHLQLY